MDAACLATSLIHSFLIWTIFTHYFPTNHIMYTQCKTIYRGGCVVFGAKWVGQLCLNVWAGFVLGRGRRGVSVPLCQNLTPIGICEHCPRCGSKTTDALPRQLSPSLDSGVHTWVCTYLQLNTCKWGSYMFTCEQVLRYVQKTLFFRRVSKLQDKIWNGKPAFEATLPNHHLTNGLF